MSDDVATEVRPRAETRPRGTTWVGLVGVELRRLWWRRLTKVVLLAIVAFVGLSMLQIYGETKPSNVAAQIDSYNAYLRDMQSQEAALTPAQRAQQLAECRAQEAQARQNDPNIEFACDDSTTATLADFGVVEPDRESLVRKTAQALAYVLGFLAFLLAASFVAAELTTGAMGNWLTFQPRRLRVASTKLAAATLAGAAVALAGIGLTVLGVVGVTTVNRPGETLDLPPAPPGDGQPLSLVLLRVLAAVALGGLGGAVLGFITRSTAAVVGVVLAYVVVIESFVAPGMFGGRLQPWFLRVNIDAFLENGAMYNAQVCGPNSCQYTTLTHSFTHSWVYLLAVAVVGVVAALLVFRRRDVG
ncbi:ABC transporter permease subunit [Terracoccus luteus]|uniref:ABC-2 type transport system permease protein n=1 Tax=Terracoccus luteus TaxID=53356 RepID=A0A495XUW9_9MICO|nr:ABC transporter permease subunit [Terracoccus luteus]MBB2984990.1 ABC-2 type transport system permease protein [Terracoccus luteus]MCP2170642.1 ABC-2 type transport system permease protein [Terracoccus luteus]RKT77752.1 ABC-2 type transport system permease protein [Terracoccus luteus]